MELVTTLEQLQTMLGEARKQRFITNFFLDPDKHGVWIAKGDCFTKIIGETLFIVRKDKDFWNVFYSTTSLEQLGCDLKTLMAENNEQVMMFDVVGREVQCQPVVTMMKEAGCKEATSLVRMTRLTVPMEYNSDSSIRFATEKNLTDISHWLHEYFDAHTEQIPYDEELMDYIRQGHVLVCEEFGEMAGFLIYEINATTLYLRYWFTHPDFRNKKVGSRLLRRFFEEGKDTKRQLFWVIRTNENAIVRYKHYGFKEENMYDYVMRFN